LVKIILLRHTSIGLAAMRLCTTSAGDWRQSATALRDVHVVAACQACLSGAGVLLQLFQFPYNV